MRAAGARGARSWPALLAPFSRYAADHGLVSQTSMRPTQVAQKVLMGLRDAFEQRARRSPLTKSEPPKVLGDGPNPSVHKIAVLGNHLPRQCGIATFTADLSRAISDEYGELECFVLAMNDPGKHYAYPAPVRFEIAATDVASYRRAADYLNASHTDVLSVQHEYGIFGGKAGAHVLALLRELRMPIVTTLHTILAEPNAAQRAVMTDLLEVSTRVVCMSLGGAALLKSVYGADPAKVDNIPHGIPRLPDARRSKARLGLTGKQTILTFGLLSPGKGLEHVIDALPAILEQHPDVVYIVLGATHPHVKERHGETYRLMLESRARRLGVAGNIIFHNRFVEPAELAEFLAAADIYVTPYLSPEQATSGTLAYAVGSGKAVISTPYLYATELLAERRGVLVPWPKDDPGGIARAVVAVLGDPALSAGIRERAAAYGRGMFWPEVARSYVASFEQARAEHAVNRRTEFRAKTLAQRPQALPEVRLDHLRLLSDDTGLLQHAIYSVPRYEDGYCLDDNARALLLMARLQETSSDDLVIVRAMMARYLAYVSHAHDRSTGRFRNFMSFARHWDGEIGSDDSQGRAIWGLGAVVGNSEDGGARSLADSIFHGGLPAILELGSPRAWAYALLGIDEYLGAFQGESKVEAIRQQLATRLLERYRVSRREGWDWFEDSVTYDNARLSQALIVSGARTGSDELLGTGLESLRWLTEVQRSERGYFAPIGSNGFHERGGARAEFDQQPIEACAMVSACLDAERATGDARWALEARRAFDWFLGQNALQQSLYDPRTGACHDGLHADRVNQNQGAEATLSFLLALVEMREAAQAAGSGNTYDRDSAMTELEESAR
jgi:glycosyltransferase involved in cell wall biosynthesis